MSTKAPESLTSSCSPRSRGTAGNGTSVSRSPFPPLYRAGTGEHPGTQTRPWLAEKVTQSRRAARPGTCPSCGADILVGPDHDTCAATARVDPTPVDRLHEVAGLLAGLHSYNLTRGDLCHREPEHHHSPRRPHPVLLEHRCAPAAVQLTLEAS